jgi:putative transposase
VWPSESNAKMRLKYRYVKRFSSRQCYGSPRIDELTKMGYCISKTTVAKWMNEMGIRSKIGKKHKVTSDSNHKEPIAENILNRDVYASAHGEKWCQTSRIFKLLKALCI